VSAKLGECQYIDFEYLQHMNSLGVDVH